MKAREIKQELDAMGIKYSDCIEKSDLVDRLRQARSGSVDPSLRQPAGSDSSGPSGAEATNSYGSTSSHASSSGYSSQSSAASQSVVEPIVIEPDQEGGYRSSASSGKEDILVEAENVQTGTNTYYSKKSSAWGDYPDSEEFFTRGRAGGSTFESSSKKADEEEPKGFRDMFDKEFPEVKRFFDFFEKPWVKGVMSVLKQPFVAIPLTLFTIFTVLKFLFLLPTLLFVFGLGVLAFSSARNRLGR